MVYLTFSFHFMATLYVYIYIKLTFALYNVKFDNIFISVTQLPCNNKQHVGLLKCNHFVKLLI